MYSLRVACDDRYKALFYEDVSIEACVSMMDTDDLCSSRRLTRRYVN